MALLDLVGIFQFLAPVRAQAWQVRLLWPGKELDLMVGEDRGDPAFFQLVVDGFHQPIKAGLVAGFGAGHQDVLRVRSTEKPPTVFGLYADPVGRIDLGPLRGEPLGNFPDDLELAAFVDLETKLWRCDRDRHLRLQLG